MGTKLSKDVYPGGHGPDDFLCFGPIATQDGDFETCKMADLGCFTQEGKDSNKAYHGSICQSKKDKRWYVYFWWGRTGSKGTFQFVECSDEHDARDEFSSQLHSKNDKRGEWVTKPGLGRILQAKAGKDCYLVRPLATRDTGSPGLPGARAVASSEVKVTTKKADTGTKKSKKDLLAQYDAETIKLMRDFNVATVQYTKTNIQGGTIPTQKSIDEGRIVLIEAQKRIAKIGDDLDAQINDVDLRQLTYHLYSRVAKMKKVGAPEKDWILSKDNIFIWEQDLNAFESALATATIELEQGSDDVDPFGGMKIEMRHEPKNSERGEFIHNWLPSATKNRHSYLGSMRVMNVWSVSRTEGKPKFQKALAKIASENIVIGEIPENQPRRRPDISAEDSKLYASTATSLTIHGTRSCNCSGLLRTGFKLSKDLPNNVFVSGKMFGDSAYTADDWKKSAGYTSLPGSYWSSGGGGIPGRGAFMFLFDIIVGRTHVARGPHGYNSPPRGCHSVFGKAGVSGVQNNEWMIYDVDQLDFRYLVEFSVK